MIRGTRIGFATSKDWPKLTEDDRLAAAALEARGATVVPVVWSEEPAPAVDTVVVRSTWDYHLRPDAFRDWISGLEARGIRVVNPPAVLRWNMDKRYLKDLAARGVAVVPTAWCGADAPPLREVMEREGWPEAVVKPVVSASGYRTFRVSLAEAAEREAAFRKALGDGEVMVQPFLPEIVDEGEWSLVFLGGEYSHAALKRAAPGGFLVQKEHGGTYQRAEPPAPMVADARRALESGLEAAGAASSPLQLSAAYARVDGVRRNDRLILVEVELLEPDLFFRMAEASADRFAAGLAGGA